MARMTADELKALDPGPDPEPFDHGGYPYEDAHRLVEEVRRLRGLILLGAEDGKVWHLDALRAEAKAIREEQDTLA